MPPHTSPKQTKLFIGGLGQEADEPGLRERLEKLGITVGSIYGPVRPETGSQWAFLYLPPEQAQKAIVLIHDRMLYGQKVHCRPAVGK